MPMKQRRQATAGVVQSLWTSKKNKTSKNNGKENKSNRPMVHVQPGSIGPISEPNSNDVLCGRGGRINSHQGNVQFRGFCEDKKVEYLATTTKKLEKAHIAADVVEKVRAQNPPGRFLKQDSNGKWWDIGDAKAIKKVGQCMREDAPATREQLSSTASVSTNYSEHEKKMKEPEQSVSVTIPLYSGNQEAGNFNHYQRPVLGHAMRGVSSHGHQPLYNNHNQSHHPTGSMEGWYPGSTLSGNNAAYSHKAMEVVHEEGAYPFIRNEVQTMDMSVERQQMDNGSGRIFPKPPSSNLSSGVSSLLAQSIISGISDGVSSLTFGDDYHNRRKQATGVYHGANSICRKRPASDAGSGFSTASHSRRHGPALGGFSPIQRANSVHSDNRSMLVDQRDNGRPAMHSHASDVSMGGFSVSMASLPSIGVGSVASVSI